jgi:hypothetical protein
MAAAVNRAPAWTEPLDQEGLSPKCLSPVCRRGSTKIVSPAKVQLKGVATMIATMTIARRPEVRWALAAQAAHQLAPRYEAQLWNFQ